MAQSHAVQFTISEQPGESGAVALAVTARYTVTTPFGVKLDKVATTHRDVTARLSPERQAKLVALFHELKTVLGEHAEAIGAKEAAQLHLIETGRLVTHELTGALGEPAGDAAAEPAAQ